MRSTTAIRSSDIMTTWRNRGNSFGMAHRHGEREGRTHTLLALHRDLPPVEFHKLPAQGQPQPRALHLLRCRPHLAELLEHLLLILGGDADSRVADRDLHESILWRCADVDPPTLRRELDRVRQQVQHDLANLPFIGLNLTKPGVDVRAKGDCPSPGPFTYQHQGILNGRREVEVRYLQLHSPRLDLRQVEDVID